MAEPQEQVSAGRAPGDSESKAAGAPSLRAEQEHEIKLVSLTNGDIGHLGMAGGSLVAPYG